ncbi:MAG TPA: inositol monophosphatase family protein, partial [Gaiellaceae bacterium]|nr:inositol monophosphatase family protein [Gaiellaceae bacterium]
WIVDPLDGTKEFGSRGRPDWAVQIALAVAGELRLGVVTLPASGVTLQSGSPGRYAPRPPGPLRMAVSRTRCPQVAVELARALGAELVPIGSVGAKVAAVIFGDADLYVHDGGQYQWDSAAPVAVARAAGLVATRLDGSALRYGGADPYLPDLLVGTPEAVQAARRELVALPASRRVLADAAA